MKQRNIWTMLALLFITFGIYQIYWFYKTSEEMRGKGQKLPSFMWYFFPFLLMMCWTFLYVTAALVLNDQTSFILTILGLSLFVMIPVSIGVSLWWIWNYVNAVEAVTNGRMSAALALIAILLLSGIGSMIIQDSFNKINAEAQAGSQPPKP